MVTVDLFSRCPLLGTNVAIFDVDCFVANRFCLADLQRLFFSCVLIFEGIKLKRSRSYEFGPGQNPGHE